MKLVLLQHGADPNLKNSDGKSALDLADSSTRPVLMGKTSSSVKKDILFVFHQVNIERMNYSKQHEREMKKNF